MASSELLQLLLRNVPIFRTINIVLISVGGGDLKLHSPYEFHVNIEIRVLASG